MIQRLLAALCLSALTALAGDLNGTWVAKVQSPNGELEVTYDLKVDDGKITGTASSHMGEMKIHEGTFKDDDVVFVLDVPVNGETRKFEHKGKLTGDELKLTLDFNGQSIEINARRSAS
jgi:hypothetical protein